MKTRKLGSFVETVVAAGVVLCVACAGRSARAEPASPSLWDTIQAADTVALVRVMNTPILQTMPASPLQLPDLPPMVIQRLEGMETWKGRRFESLERQISLWVCDLGCVPGETVVAFLSRENGTLTPTVCSYGNLEDRPEVLASLRKQIRRAVSIQEKESAGFAEKIDWLADQAENSETRVAALYELRPEGDRESYADESFLRRPLAPYLTTPQLDRIERAFVRRRPADVSLPSFLLILADRTSRSIDDAALAVIKSAMSSDPYPEEWLTDSMGLVLERFGDIDGRVRARLLLESEGADMVRLRELWTQARRDLGIPDAPREDDASGETDVPVPPLDGR